MGYQDSKDPSPALPAALLRYAIGTLDERFGISRDHFLKIIAGAASIWEEPVRMSLFQYDSSASFTINLIFDQRQQRMLEAKAMKAKLDTRGKSYDNLVDEYNSQLEEKQRLEKNYEHELSAYNERLERHNSDAAYWNNRGGAPSEEFAKLEQDRAGLDDMTDALTRKRVDINQAVADLNGLAKAIDKVAEEHNLEIKLYNGKFVESREFEKGVFNGRQINIFEYNGENDLKATLVHEMGHALGFNHVDDPKAIMFPILEKQDLTNIHLTPADARLVTDKFSGGLVNAKGKAPVRADYQRHQGNSSR
ncbi:MAG: matrixin family metalloprotease [Ignavibacteria bacterium]|nr:MAG: matrixin family metalloprotease [Ignavibacteria bacterium]